MQVLATLERLPGNPWVIPGTRPGAHLSSIFEPWRRVRARAGLDDVRLHDLRHSYASRALALGESLPVIAKLLGHAQIQTTARYTHLTRDAVRDAAIRVAQIIGDDIAPEGGPDPTASGLSRRDVPAWWHTGSPEGPGDGVLPSGGDGEDALAALLRSPRVDGVTEGR